MTRLLDLCYILACFGLLTGILGVGMAIVDYLLQLMRGLSANEWHGLWVVAVLLVIAARILWGEKPGGPG